MTSRTTTITTTTPSATHRNLIGMPSNTNTSNTNNHQQRSRPLPLPHLPRRSHRLSTDTSSTDNTSFASIVVQPTQNGHRNHHQPLSRSSPPRSLSKKRKPHRTFPDSDSEDSIHRSSSRHHQRHPPPSNSSTHIQPTPKRHKTGSHPPEDRNTPYHSQTRIIPSLQGSRPSPATIKKSAGLFTFTTKRFQTPAKPDSSFSADENPTGPGTGSSPFEPRLTNGHHHYPGTSNHASSHPAPAPVPSLHPVQINGRNPKGKGRANAHAPDRARTRRHPSVAARTSEGRPSPDPPPSHPPARTRTPKKKHPNIYGLNDRTEDGEISLAMAETPVHIKNRTFRQGGRRDDQSESGGSAAGDRPQSRPSSTSSRRSSRSRGGRASSIGNGHEALPHPQVECEVLHRHIQLDLPPMVRCRTLLSWCSQKAQEISQLALYPDWELNKFSFNSVPSPVKTSITRLIGSSGEMSEVGKKVVEDVVQKVIKGVCANTLDLTWTDAPPTMPRRDMIQDPGPELPPNPQDLVNLTKATELENWRQRLSYEDGARQYELSRYSTLLTRLSSQPLPPPPPPLPPLDCPEEPTRSLERSTLEDAGRAVELGRRLRQAQTDKRELDVALEVGGGWAEARSQIAILAESAHLLYERVSAIETSMDESLADCTRKLAEIELSEERRREECKLMVNTDDRLRWCLDGMSEVREREVGGVRNLLRSLTRAG
ncbi:hypothetical protein CROQUDRAFT_669633 [Cronartium quercuum f. sp. fusiforme G11]|uniref:Uncharacterized protein n=1 Tax=Cronartium quercuum f. sp. fusiforme G11 TaxID=708437 RepID=A0A9P6TEI0_9BASI|nr:hypothetical protein CROQUDRAFT_669633 [Cronartium quercuum f. sp. fusiforme G11]